MSYKIRIREHELTGAIKALTWVVESPAFLTGDDLRAAAALKIRQAKGEDVSEELNEWAEDLSREETG